MPGVSPPVSGRTTAVKSVTRSEQGSQSNQITRKLGKRARLNWCLENVFSVQWSVLNHRMTRVCSYALVSFITGHVFNFYIVPHTVLYSKIGNQEPVLIQNSFHFQKEYRNRNSSRSCVVPSLQTKQYFQLHWINSAGSSVRVKQTWQTV